GQQMAYSPKKVTPPTIHLIPAVGAGSLAADIKKNPPAMPTGHLPSNCASFLDGPPKISRQPTARQLVQQA
ncbi:hypothetical protein, partial [Mesorhizobium sp. 128a]